MSWNYRVMRHTEMAAANDQTFYAIHEVHYNEDSKVIGWTEEATGSPFGETMEEMVGDLAWIMTALSKPVLEYGTGLEVEPAAMLADDLSKMIREEQSGTTATEVLQ